MAIELNGIQERVGRGAYTAADVNALLSEVELCHKVIYGTPTSAEQFAAAQAAQAAAIADASVARAAQAAREVAAAQEAEAEKMATAKAATDKRAAAVAAQAAVEQNIANAAAANAILDEKAKVAGDLKNQLNVPDQPESGS